MLVRVCGVGNMTLVLATYAILVSAVAHLGERLLLIPPERGVPRELATVLLMWEVITLAVALLPTLPVVNELLFSCVLILGVVHPTQVDAIVQTHVVPRMTRRPIVEMTYDVAPISTETSENGVAEDAE